MSIRKVALAAVATLLVSSPSFADVFDFSYDIPAAGGTMGEAASGVLVADPTATPGEFTVTSITGQRNGEQITGLLPADSFGFSDNMIFTGDPHVDNLGLSYTVAGAGDDGLGDVNVFSILGQYSEDDVFGMTPTFTLTPEAAATPLPAGLPLFATGIGLLGLFGWYRSRSTSASAMA